MATTTATGQVRFTARQAERLYARAHEAGMAALEAARPTPMYVVQRANPFDDSSPIVRRYAPVEGGTCGFASVVVHPGNGSFARRMRAAGRGSAEYGGGYMVKWVREGGQSLTRKEAYAQAFAEVLREAGVRAFAQSRMD